MMDLAGMEKSNRNEVPKYALHETHDPCNRKGTTHNY
jgi:hypothetical protein